LLADAGFTKNRIKPTGIDEFSTPAVSCEEAKMAMLMGKTPWCERLAPLFGNQRAANGESVSRRIP